jgi:hypothetical protein
MGLMRRRICACALAGDGELASDPDGAMEDRVAWRLAIAESGPRVVVLPGVAGER